MPPHQRSSVAGVESWRGTYGCQWNWFPYIIDDVNADKHSRMSSKVFQAIVSAPIQLNALKFQIGWEEPAEVALAPN